MAKISKSQKAALEAAGYVVKGDSVQNKSGGSVGGYNANGKIWSGSDKVKNILKAPEPTAAPATKSASKPKAKTPVAKSANKGYKKGDVATMPIPKQGVTPSSKSQRSRSLAVKNAGVKAITDRATKALNRVDEATVNKTPVPGAALGRAILNGTNPKLEAEKDAAKRAAAKARLLKYKK